MNIIVYGGTGFLGSHVVEQLAMAGYKPLCIVRESSKTDFLASLDVDLLIDDFATVTHRSYINEGDIVINCIADTRRHIRFSEQAKTDIQLTGQLFKLAQTHKAARFIQLSTVMAYGFDRPESAIDERYPLPCSRSKSKSKSKIYTYNRVAIAREKTLLSLNDESKTELIIVRPSNAIGARDTSFLPNITMPMRFGLFPVVSDRKTKGGSWQFSCIDARDVGRAFVHLIDVKINKPEIYLIKGFDLTWLELKNILEKKLNKKCKTIPIPKSFMMASAKLMEWLTPYGTKLPLTQFDVEVISNHTLFDNSKVRSTQFTSQYDLQECLTAALQSRSV